MAPPRHSDLLRTLTLLLLVWVGFDIGAHGLFASDFTPIATIGSSLRLSHGDGGDAAPAAPDHCFCHGISVPAAMPTPTASLTSAGRLVLDLSLRGPSRTSHPLDRPPQLAA
jgi:hypothetical protein